MAILITRTVVVPIWLLVCAFVLVWSSPPGPVATGLLVLLSGLAALAIVLLRKPAANVPARPRFSWPNSGFRNIGRGTKRG